MYRQWRFMPEANKPCCRASYERGYNAHLDALRRIRTKQGTIDSSQPRGISRNSRRCAYEKQRLAQLSTENRSAKTPTDAARRDKGRSRLPAFLNRQTSQRPQTKPQPQDAQKQAPPKTEIARHRTMFDD